MSNRSDHACISQFKTLIIPAILCAVACIGGAVYPEFLIAGLLVCAATAVLIPMTLSNETLNLIGIAAGAGKLAVLALPVCFIAALYAEVGAALTVIFTLSVFMLQLYILLTVAVIRLAVVGKQSPFQLALSIIGYFVALFVPSVLLINSYNSCTPSYFCYERDIYLAGFDLGYLILPCTLAAVVTFVIAPMLSKLSRSASMGWIAVIYGSFILLWLFFPRIPMAETDGRNPYYYKLIIGHNDFTERAVEWLMFAVMATITAWGVSFVCRAVRCLRNRDNIQK